MSNRRRPRGKKQPKSKRGTVTPQEHESLASVRGSMHQLARQGLAGREGWAPGENGARQRMWTLSEQGKRHARMHAYVSATALTAAGLLRASIPREWAGYGNLIDGGRLLTRITDPATGATGVARIVRLNRRRGLAYLDPEWGAVPAEARSQADARAEARARAEPCPSCGKPQGEDCMTAAGKRAAWPHAGRDPLQIAWRQDDGEQARIGA